MAELQKDLVLSPNEYSYVLDETKGNVACNVGPHKMSLSQSDTLVYFDTKTKSLFLVIDTKMLFNLLPQPRRDGILL